MKVVQKNMLEFMDKGDMRFVIPAYQRLYSWNETQCEELWLDILRAARGKRNHFLGTVLYNVARDGKIPDHIKIIDGQQRLTSVSLVILALARYLESHSRSCSADTSDAATLISRYLVMSDTDGSDPITKLLPSHHDAGSYDAVIRGGDGNPMSSITRNLSFFQKKMAEDDFDYEQLLEGLRRLTTIFVEVDDFRDAQPIFESVNSKGMPLNVADMVRNYLLLTESHDEQTRLFEEYWKVSQEMFAPDPGSLKLNTGIKSWLAIRLKGARIQSAEQTYASFKRYVEDVYRGEKEPILRELRGFCLMWAENYRYHGVKKYRSGSDWAKLGAPALTSGYKLKKADNEEYARQFREKLRNADSRW